MRGDPLAIRVISLKPPAARRSSEACSSIDLEQATLVMLREVWQMADNGNEAIVFGW